MFMKNHQLFSFLCLWCRVMKAQRHRWHNGCVLVSSFSLFLPQPQNILLTSLSPLGDIKIVDFGLARKLGTAGELREILGTPEYVGE